jgi:PAS domain S-box-containing protein
MDPNGYILTWNEGGKKIKGYTAHEIIGKNFSVFYPTQEVDAGKPADILKIAVAAGKYEEEGWRVRKDGSQFWAGLVITALYNQENELIGFSKVTRDLTEKKKAEEKLHLNDQRYRLLVEQVKDYGIFMLDEQGKIDSWNEGARLVTGYRAEEVLGKHFSIFYLEEDKLNDKPDMELKEVVEEGKFEEQGWRVRKDGSIYWSRINITAIYNNNNNLVGFAKIIRDITESRESEMFLRGNNRMYKTMANMNRTFIQQSPHAMAMFDKDMRYMAASWKWIADYKLEETNLLGASHYEIFPEIGEDWKEIIQECLDGRINTSPETPYLRADGSLQCIAWDIRPWYTTERTIGGLLMYTKEITRSKITSLQTDWDAGVFEGDFYE